MPGSRKMVVYVIGPGFGESVVVSLPDGKWLVVDCYSGDSDNLTQDVLLTLGCKAIDLLVITHPDVDHIAGADQLIARFPVSRMWRYPGSGTLNDLLPNLVRRDKGDKRLKRLNDALIAMDDLHDKNVAHEVGTETRAWQPAGATYQVHCIAPTENDVTRYRRALKAAIVEWKASGSPQLARPFKEFLLGDKRTLGAGGNPLSLALSIDWEGWGLLFAGDVETGPNALSGWRGVLDILAQDNRTALVVDRHVVKVAHHGSRGAFSVGAWTLHAKTRAVSVAAIAPFSKGDNPPPHTDVLVELAKFSTSLAITAEPAPGWAVVPGAQWTAASGSAAATKLPILAIALEPGKAPAVAHGAAGRQYQRV